MDLSASSDVVVHGSMLEGFIHHFAGDLVVDQVLDFGCQLLESSDLQPIVS